MIAMKIVSKLLKDHAGFVACMDAEENFCSTFTGNKITGEQFSFMVAALINDLSLRTKVPVREILQDITQAAYLVEANHRQIKYKGLEEVQ